LEGNLVCKKRLEIRLSAEELEKIKKNASKIKMEYHAFTRKSATDMCIVLLNNDVITEHKKQISAYFNCIVDLFYTVIKISRYVPCDLDEIVKISNNLLDCENVFLNSYIKDFERKEKTILKVLREVTGKNTK
jgi:hypothetical protein